MNYRVALLGLLLLPWAANGKPLTNSDQDEGVIPWLTQQYKEYWLNEDIHRTEDVNTDGGNVCTFTVEDSQLYDYQPEFADDVKLVCLHFLKWPEGYPSEQPLSAEVRFTIGPDGKITDVVPEADSPAVKQEMERMFSSLPKALPAWQDGKAVASSCVVRLHLSKSEWDQCHRAETEADSRPVYVDPELPAHPSDGLNAFQNYLSTLLPEKSSGKLLYSFVVKKDE